MDVNVDREVSVYKIKIISDVDYYKGNKTGKCG